MKYDAHGVAYSDTEELFWLLHETPDLDLTKFLVSDSTQFNKSVAELYAEVAPLRQYQASDLAIEEFDQSQQNTWHMPENYKNFDIAQWLLDQCTEPAELQRIGQELLLFQERNMFDLLRYLKYFVDTMRHHNIVWGLGRGSSVASYALFLIGVHKINSLYYDLDINEFLK